MTTVVAAVIERDGRILVCQRKPDQLHPLKWEFPGGKVETGESCPGALLRELQEELDIAAGIGDEITRYEYRYPERNPILLIFYRVTQFTDEPRNLVFHRIAWERPEALPAYDFLEGDVEFVRRLADGGFTPERRRPESAP